MEDAILSAIRLLSLCLLDSSLNLNHLNLENNHLELPAGWYISEYSPLPHVDDHNALKCKTSSPSKSIGFNLFAEETANVEDSFWEDAKRFYCFRYSQVTFVELYSVLLIFICTG